MPDWTYQTIFRPILRRLPYSVAQSLAFGPMGMLGRNLVGRAVLRFIGHAKPDKSAAVGAGDVTLIAPTALGCGVDLDAQALSALSLFGFGMIEVGPVDIGQSVVPRKNLTQWHEDGLRIPITGRGIPVEDLCRGLHRNHFRNGVCVVVRVADSDEIEFEAIRNLVSNLNSLVDGISIKLPVTEDGAFDVLRLNSLARELHDRNCRLFVVLRADVVLRDVSRLVDTLSDIEGDGVIIESLGDNATKGGLTEKTRQEAQAAVRRIRPRVPNRLLIANGGVKQPRDALCLLNAGADVVMVDGGLAAAGPGLPKRINTAAAALRIPSTDTPVPVPHRSWFWLFVLGTSLLIGGLMAMVIGWTRVVLPYDEEFLGMLREEICGLNPQLLPFMSHDRVTLAGTMLALGPLYMALTWFGDRTGMAWARTAVLTSSLIGFLSFFLFLGFGYFDPFHAFISAILFQLMTLGLRSSQPKERRVLVDIDNDSSWKQAMWGQLLMVVQGAAIVVAGLTICRVGVTSVFVADDLAFMQTTRDILVDANPRLLPMVAHDRASFGGMLMSTGVVVLLSAMWGWQQGRRWLWWTLLASGTVAYSTTILIHWRVGYTSLRHLIPAYAGLMALWLALMLSRRWMFAVVSESKDEAPA